MFFFVSTRTTGDLSLTTPLECCCNCGIRRSIELVETPLQKTKYFLFFGSEISLKETFPYCKQCRSSAKRVKLSFFSRLLCALMFSAALFLVFIFTAKFLPKLLSENLFESAAIIGLLTSIIYFYWRSSQSKKHSYYQPVSLIDVELNGGALNLLRLKFYNEKYADLFSKANLDLISVGILRIEIDGRAGH